MLMVKEETNVFFFNFSILCGGASNLLFSCFHFVCRAHEFSRSMVQRRCVDDLCRYGSDANMELAQVLC